jgi:hypothetical protein
MFVRVVGSRHLNIVNLKAPWLSRLVSGLSPWIFAFYPRPVHVGFRVDTVAV